MEKIKLEDFLIEGEVQNKLLLSLDCGSNYKYFLKENFDFDDYDLYKLNEATSEDIKQIVGSVSKSNIEKANFILDHSHDKLIADIRQSRGNITAMHYYDTIEKMLGDLNRTCPHNKEIMKANQIIHELSINRQTYITAFAKDNIFRKSVYTSSVFAAVYTIIKEHLMCTDFTSSKNEGKFVMKQHVTDGIIDNDNLKNLDRNLQLLTKRNVNPHAPKSNMSKLGENSSIYDVYKHISLMEDGIFSGVINSGADAIADKTADKVSKTFAIDKLNQEIERAKADYEKPLTTPLQYKHDFLNEFKKTIGVDFSTASKEEKELAMTLLKDPKNTEALENLRRINPEAAAKFSNLTSDEISQLQTLANTGGFFSDIFGALGNGYNHIKNSYNELKDKVSDHWADIGDFALIAALVLIPFQFAGGLGKVTQKMIMYLDTYEYVRNVSKNGTSNSDRLVAKVMDKISGFKQFLLRMWIDNKSKNVQEYMKDLGKEIEVIKKNEVQLKGLPTFSNTQTLHTPIVSQTHNDQKPIQQHQTSINFF